uniref:Uncharacterized protein n=1 Tax=Bradyrhizobium ottawaense TaxID=931866 RepID=A0A2U8P2D1_9BRAD|nr:hypothetical protein CIT37_06405 [Bradyrhizobium ottawaense]
MRPRCSAPSYQIVGCLTGKTRQRWVNQPRSKYSTLPKFGFGVCVAHPDPAKGAVVRRHEPRIGERWTRQRRAREAGAGRENPVRSRRRADERR